MKPTPIQPHRLTTNELLKALGYTAEASPFLGKKKVYRHGKLLGQFTAWECTGLFKERHPELYATTEAA